MLFSSLQPFIDDLKQQLNRSLYQPPDPRSLMSVNTNSYTKLKSGSHTQSSVTITNDIHHYTRSNKIQNNIHHRTSHCHHVQNHDSENHPNMASCSDLSITITRHLFLQIQPQFVTHHTFHVQPVTIPEFISKCCRIPIFATDKGLHFNIIDICTDLAKLVAYTETICDAQKPFILKIVNEHYEDYAKFTKIIQSFQLKEFMNPLYDQQSAEDFYRKRRRRKRHKSRVKRRKAIAITKQLNKRTENKEQKTTEITNTKQKTTVQHPNFTNNRSIFYEIEKRCCAMRILEKQMIKFKISLHPDDIIKMKNNQSMHLRLFNFVTLQHQEWNSSKCDVSINNKKIIIHKTKTRSGVKNKGHHIVAPLDITKEVCNTMDFVVTSNGTFNGIVVIEIVRVFSVESIAQRIIARCAPIDAQRDKKCAICGETRYLLRCSRCKCVSYCSTKHQEKHWRFHQTTCVPRGQQVKLKPISFKQSSDDDVVCGEIKVSLRCPLSICRINIPIRGTECAHPQCIDLNTFLSFSHRTGVWQCPVCLKPLQFNQIVIDDGMKEILCKTDNDIDLVRLYPNGSFKEITLQQQREEDSRVSKGISRKKRKIKQMDDGIQPLQPQNLAIVLD